MTAHVEELIPAPAPAEVAARFADAPHFAWLDSAAEPDRLGRYSYITADPIRAFHGETALDDLRAALRPHARPAHPDLPPFQGGAVGYLAYDFGRTLERIPPTRHDDLALPVAIVGLYDWVIAWDHQQQRCWLIVQPLQGDAHRLKQRLTWINAHLDGPLAAKPPTPHASFTPSERAALAPTTSAAGAPPSSATGAPPTYPVLGLPHTEEIALRSTFTRRGYIDAVQRVREYIIAGDIFQANLSQRFETTVACAPFALYSALRRRNPAPFAACLLFGGTSVLSASPERFLRLDGRSVETRPIKGTAPRGLGPMHDFHLGLALTESTKDRAENVMIVDLLRNDLSRVCAPGSVRVPALFALESHPTVHHLVSTVTGCLAAGHDAVDLLRATFPGGSITGAPKVRAMEIIAELEPTARGVYCGAIGWIGFDGAMDTSIVIRTYVMQGARVVFQAGGGIIYDSSPEAEYEETLTKARALIETLASVPR